MTISLGSLYSVKNDTRILWPTRMSKDGSVVYFYYIDKSDERKAYYSDFVAHCEKIQ